MTVIDVDMGNIKKTYQGLRRLAKELRGDDFGTDVRQAVLEILLEDLTDNIAYITDLDGNSAGTQTIIHNPNISVIRWSGEQVAYLEFGTGSVGLERGYEGSTMSLVGYQPQDHAWVYTNKETGKKTFTEGIPAYAPMYKVFLYADTVLSKGDLKTKLSQIFDQAVQRAFS